ncbi:MAG: fumarylacetoacetate hydrolase family protein [Prevotella sp.]|nr:fumarylacetoacetate hydrolase family protein [Candidatus Equicola faecalis]
MKIIAVGMNYPQHNKEMNETLYKGTDPVIFLKADSSYLRDGKPFFLPDELGRIEYEGEIVVRISRLGKGIERRFAHRYYDAVSVGIDFTARQMQQQFRQQGLPWDLSKGFDGAAAIGTWVSVDELSHDADEHSGMDNLKFRLERNGECVQKGCSSEMTHGIDELIEYVSRFMTLRMGDVIFTGTPAGVGQVAIGDRFAGFLGERKVLEIKVK